MTLPITLLIDDGGPINPMHYVHPMVNCEFIVPNAFTEEFADLCAAYGVRGKFSVMPMPTELGRLDRRLNYVPQEHLEGFLKIAREKIAPLFDITPEILTHACAYNLKTGGTHHVFEDIWFQSASLEEMTDYIALALRILKNVGLPANGVTSPWSTGITNETTYAEAIGRAQWRVHRRKFTWYFLHCFGPDGMRWPWITWQSKTTGQKVVTVATGTGDFCWSTQGQPSRRAARQAASKAADTYLSRDGRSGAVREMFDRGVPIALLTHWQSLFSDGRAAGLHALEMVLKRVGKTFGDQIEWVTCSKLARAALK